MANECIFCQILAGSVASVKIWEDSDHIAILDASPITEGMVVVMPKKHFDSNVFDMPRVEYKNFMLATKKAAKFLERGLRADKTFMVAEGLEINHVHIKLYPYFNKSPTFPGLGIQSGQRRTLEELQKVASKILANNK